MGEDDYWALVVLIDDPSTGAFYLTAETCLSQLAKLARLIEPKVGIAITYGHTEAKWKGRGQR